jgi:hypothetical protein
VDDARDYVLYKSALLTNQEGDVVGRFDKQKLVMFSEEMPFGETFPILYEWSPNSGKFVSGKRYDPLTAGEHQIATVICYEDIIPGFVNRIVNNGNPDLIANLTNDAWFGDTTEPWIHLALAKLRAIEHRRYFVRSTNSGVSAVVDPVGRLVVSTPTFEQAARATEVRWLRGTTAYEVLGDIPLWLLSAAAAALALITKRRKASFRLERNRLTLLSSGSLPAAPARWTLVKARLLANNPASAPSNPLAQRSHGLSFLGSFRRDQGILAAPTDVRLQEYRDGSDLEIGDWAWLTQQRASDKLRGDERR